MELKMNTDQVFDLIESVAATSSKNDKITMLKACAGSDMLRDVLRAAYDPTESYGIKNIPERNNPFGSDLFNQQTWTILAQMRDRALTGNAMQNAVREELNRLSPKSAELFKRILLKNMRADFSEETTNKVFPGLVPDFPYMRCCLPKDAAMENWDWTEGHISQEKADGMFANVDFEDTGEVFISSRQGSMFPMDKFESLVSAIKVTFECNTQSHGELLVSRDGVVLPREIGNGILNSVIKGGDFGPGETPVFVVWDQIPLSAVKPKGKYNVPYITRLKGLISQLKRNDSGVLQLVQTRIVRSIAEAYAHYCELLAKGKEGTIVKNRDAIWHDGTSKEQVKLKLEFVVDLQVVGIVPGKANGKNAGRAGSMACVTSCGKLRVDVTVKNEKMRAEVDANPNEWIDKIISVKVNGIMKPSESSDFYSLFLPRMVEPTYRMDKSVADDLSSVFAQEGAAKLGAAILKKAA